MDKIRVPRIKKIAHPSHQQHPTKSHQTKPLTNTKKYGWWTYSREKHENNQIREIIRWGPRGPGGPGGPG